MRELKPYRTEHGLQKALDNLPSGPTDAALWIHNNPLVQTTFK